MNKQRVNEIWGSITIDLFINLGAIAFFFSRNDIVYYKKLL